MKQPVFSGPLLMAPMAGITGLPFRRRLRRWGCASLFTEMVSASALIRRHRATLRMASPPDRDDGMALQLFGSKSVELGEASRIASDLGWTRLDLNMGCPVKKVVSSGAGSALMRDLKTAAACVGAMRRGFPCGILTVKMRAGWVKGEENYLEAAKMAEGEGVDGIILHPRHRSQGYSGSADWEMIARLSSSIGIPVAGSGDVKSAGDGVGRLRDFGVAAVMIGRAALSRPWIFRDAQRMLEGLPPLEEPSSAEIAADLLLQYDDLSVERGIEAAVGDIKKFVAWAMRDFCHCARARKAVMEIKDAELMRRAITRFGDGTLVNEESDGES